MKARYEIEFKMCRQITTLQMGLGEFLKRMKTLQTAPKLNLLTIPKPVRFLKSDRFKIINLKYLHSRRKFRSAI